MQVWASLEVKNFGPMCVFFVAEWNFSKLTSSFRASIVFPDRSDQRASYGMPNVEFCRQDVEFGSREVS